MRSTHISPKGISNCQLPISNWKSKIGNWKFVLAVLSTLFIFVSCKTKKSATQNEPATNCKIDRRLPRPLIADMRRSEFHFEWLAAKLSCEASDDSAKFEFDVTLRMRKDSAIWMLVTGPLGIKVARVLITVDSVKFIQYQDGSLSAQPKCFQGNFALLSELLQTDVDFEMMQSLLVGNSVSFYEEDEKLKASVNHTECTYTLSTIRKRKLRRMMDGQKPLKDEEQAISLDPATFKILRILFLDAQNRTFTVNYSEFAPEDSMIFPHRAQYYAKGLKKSARLDVSYKRVDLNLPQTFPFTIPDDCQPIIIQEPKAPNAPQPRQPGQQ
jgi:hypothetical protein